MVVPTCPMTVRSLTAMEIIVNAKTKPAAVTTDPVPAMDRMMPVFRPAWSSSFIRETRSRL